MDETIESLKVAIAVERAAREKAEAERDDARNTLGVEGDPWAAYSNSAARAETLAERLAAAQKRIEALEGALRVCFDFACEGWARNSPFVRDRWLGFKQAETIRSVLDAAPAGLASPSESAPQPTPETRVDLEALEKLLAEATKPPWVLRASSGAGDDHLEWIEGDGRGVMHTGESCLCAEDCKDKAAVVALRNVAPSLIAELRARRSAPTGQQQEAEARSLTYLACPYSHPERTVRVARFEAANLAASTLMRAGHKVFSPISHTHPIAEAGALPLGWDFWQAFDRAYLSHSGRIIVLRVEGWEQSKGVQAEIAIAAEYGIPVEYIDPAAAPPSAPQEGLRLFRHYPLPWSIRTDYVRVGDGMYGPKTTIHSHGTPQVRDANNVNIMSFSRKQEGDVLFAEWVVRTANAALPLPESALLTKAAPTCKPPPPDTWGCVPFPEQQPLPAAPAPVETRLNEEEKVADARRQYMAAGSMRGDAVHALDVDATIFGRRSPPQAVCGADNISPTNEPWNPGSAWACKFCLRKLSHMAPATSELRAAPSAAVETREGEEKK